MACEDGPVFYEVMQRTVPDGVEEIRDFRGLMEHLPQLSGEKSSEKADRAPEDVLFRGAVFDRGAGSVLEGQAAEITPGQIKGVVGGLSTQTGTDWAAAQVQGADMGALGGGDGHESGAYLVVPFVLSRACLLYTSRGIMENWPVAPVWRNRIL